MKARVESGERGACLLFAWIVRHEDLETFAPGERRARIHVGDGAAHRGEGLLGGDEVVQPQVVGARPGDPARSDEGPTRPAATSSD